MAELLEITADKFTFRVAADRLYSPEGVWFRERAEEVGFKQAVAERDSGEPIAPHVSKR